MTRVRALYAARSATCSKEKRSTCAMESGQLLTIWIGPPAPRRVIGRAGMTYSPAWTIAGAVRVTQPPEAYCMFVLNPLEPPPPLDGAGGVWLSHGIVKWNCDMI